jgi:hypothetical protein
MMRRGVEMAFEEVNAARRPGEPPFELAIREDTPRWGSSANATVDLTWREGASSPSSAASRAMRPTWPSGLPSTYPFDLTRRDEAWSAFHQRFRERYAV